MMAPAVAPTAKTRDMGRVDLGHQVTRQEMLDIENELIRLFGKDANGNPLLIPVTDPSGFSIIKTGTDTSGLPKGWEKSVKKFVKDQYGTDIAYGHNAAQGTFGRLGPTEPAPALTGDWDFKPSAYLKEIDWAFAHADDTVTRNVDAYLRHSGKETERIDDFISSKFKNAGERSKILQETRRVLASGGLQGLRDAVKSGALPVILMGAFGLQLSEEQPQAQNTLAVSPRG